MTLKDTVFRFWDSNIEKYGLDNYQTDFIRFVGTNSSSNEYNNILATLVNKIKERPKNVLCFDNDIPMEINFNIAQSIKSELATMDITSLSTQNIVMFKNEELNKKFLEALEYTVNLAIRQESFTESSLRNNFIVNLLLYTYTHVLEANINFTNIDYVHNKAVYYGNINRTEIYFLILLYKFGFDVYYINPLNNPSSKLFSEIDTDNLSNLILESGVIPIQTLATKANQGTVIEQVNSFISSIENSTENVFTNSGFFKPWQFRSGNTVPVFYNSSLIDLKNNLDVQARLREGFKVLNDNVYIPHFFWEIQGEYKDFKKYSELVKQFKDSPNTIYITNNISVDMNLEDRFKLPFCQNSDGTFNPEKIKQLSFYKYDKYDNIFQDFIINKINELLSREGFFTQDFDKEDILILCLILLNLPAEIRSQIDSFDFPNEVPKLVLFYEYETSMNLETFAVIALLNQIGFDIIVLTPAGLVGLDKYINKSSYNSIRLDKVNYSRTSKDVLRKASKKIFRIF